MTELERLLIENEVDLITIRETNENGLSVSKQGDFVYYTRIPVQNDAYTLVTEKRYLGDHKFEILEADANSRIRIHDIVSVMKSSNMCHIPLYKIKVSDNIEGLVCKVLPFDDLLVNDGYPSPEITYFRCNGIMYHDALPQPSRKFDRVDFSHDEYIAMRDTILEYAEYHCEIINRIDNDYAHDLDYIVGDDDTIARATDKHGYDYIMMVYPCGCPVIYTNNPVGTGETEVCIPRLIPYLNGEEA